MQGDADSSMFEVVATADWLQLLSRHAAEQEDSIRFDSSAQRLIYLTVTFGGVTHKLVRSAWCVDFSRMAHTISHAASQYHVSILHNTGMGPAVKQGGLFQCLP